MAFFSALFVSRMPPNQKAALETRSRLQKKYRDTIRKLRIEMQAIESSNFGYLEDPYWQSLQSRMNTIIREAKLLLNAQPSTEQESWR